MLYSALVMSNSIQLFKLMHVSYGEGFLQGVINMIAKWPTLNLLIVCLCTTNQINKYKLQL